MKIQCQACQAEFRVDEARIPEKGVQSTCKKCGARFFITRQGVRAEEKPVAASLQTDSDAHQRKMPGTAPANGEDLSELETRLGKLIEADDQDAAAAVFLEMVTRCAKSCDLEKAEKLHARMYDETPMALNAIIEAGEVIEAQKGDMIDPDHLDRWEGIYSLLTQEETTTLSFSLKDISYGSEATVFQQGDLDGRLFLVEKGLLKMVCADPEASEETTIQEIRAGEVFGADHFFSFSVCTYSAVAVEDCHLKCLEKSYRFKWLAELPNLENKLQTYCSTLEKASDIVEQLNIERRSNVGRSSKVKATIQMIDSEKISSDWSKSVRFSEVSPGGACLDVKLSKPEEAEALLGEIVKINFTLQVSGAEKQVRITARVVAVDLLSFGDGAIHIQFTKALSEKALALF